MTYAPPGTQQDSAPMSGLLVIRKAFTAGGGGSADDVVLYNATAPFGFRIVDVKLYVSTAVLLSTVTLRNATGGGGSALFAALSSATVGSLVLPTTESASASISAGGTLVLRRSDNGVAGELILYCVRV